MKTGKRIVVGLLMVTLAFGTVAGISFAADKEGTTTATSNFVNGCRGFFGGAATDLSKLLGLKPAELYEKRQSGQSLADIAKDQGVKEDQVVQTMLDSRKKFLDERVKAGIITQEQENQILERMKANITNGIENKNVGPGPGGGGCGMMGGPGGCCGQGGRGPGTNSAYGPGMRGFGPGGYRNAPAAAPSGNI